MNGNTAYYDAPFSDEARRRNLYEGRLFVYLLRKSTLAFIQHVRKLIEEAFAPYDPEQAQFHLPVERYAEIPGKLKPYFIHHLESKMHVKAVLTELGCDPDKTHFDVPKMRSSTSDNNLTTGIAYGWHPHRDTWNSAPPQPNQLGDSHL